MLQNVTKRGLTCQKSRVIFNRITRENVRVIVPLKLKPPYSGNFGYPPMPFSRGLRLYNHSPRMASFLRGAVMSRLGSRDEFSEFFSVS